MLKLKTQKPEKKVLNCKRVENAPVQWPVGKEDLISLICLFPFYVIIPHRQLILSTAPFKRKVFLPNRYMQTAL